MLHLLTCPYVQDKYAIITSTLLILIVLLFAESALEVSPDQGVEGEVADLPDEELLDGEELDDAGEDEELVADLEIGKLLLGLVEIIKFETNKHLQLELVGDASLSPWIVHHTGKRISRDVRNVRGITPAHVCRKDNISRQRLLSIHHVLCIVHRAL